jgi:hypothetical protein
VEPVASAIGRISPEYATPACVPRYLFVDGGPRQLRFVAVPVSGVNPFLRIKWRLTGDFAKHKRSQIVKDLACRRTH